MRRKTIANNLKSYFKFSTDTIEEILKKAELSPQIRGEKLETAQLVNLSNIIYEFKKSR